MHDGAILAPDGHPRGRTPRNVQARQSIVKRRKPWFVRVIGSGAMAALQSEPLRGDPAGVLPQGLKREAGGDASSDADIPALPPQR
jgi:hypothetical protein